MKHGRPRICRAAGQARASAALATNQIYLSMPMSRHELRILETRDRLQVADLCAGRATAAATRELRASATLSVRLADLGFGCADDAHAAGVVLDAAAGGQQLDAEALAAVGRLVDHLAAQRGAAPRGRIMQAMGLVGWR